MVAWLQARWFGLDVPCTVGRVGGRLRLVLPSMLYVGLVHSGLRPGLLLSEAAFCSLLTGRAVRAETLLGLVRQVSRLLDPVEEATHSLRSQ